MSDEEEEVQTLIDQLKDTTSFNKKVQKKKEFSLNKEELEQFILDSSGKLITDSLTVLDNITDYVEAAPDAESVSSLAELMKASTNAIDTLNKVLIQDKKSATQFGVKQMDIDAKMELAETNSAVNTLTREEVFKKLLSDAKVIDIQED